MDFKLEARKLVDTIYLGTPDDILFNFVEAQLELIYYKGKKDAGLEIAEIVKPKI